DMFLAEGDFRSEPEFVVFVDLRLIIEQAEIGVAGDLAYRHPHALDDGLFLFLGLNDEDQLGEIAKLKRAACLLVGNFEAFGVEQMALKPAFEAPSVIVEIGRVHQDSSSRIATDRAWAGSPSACASATAA